MTRKTKIVVQTSLVLVFLILIAKYFIGWHYSTYDNKNPLIGTRFIFNTSMLYISGFTTSLTGDYITDHFEYVIKEVEHWKELSKVFPEASSMKVPNSEEFEINKVFYIRAAGYLTRAFKNEAKYYVIKSNQGIEAVLYDEHYKMYAEPFNE